MKKTVNIIKIMLFMCLLSLTAYAGCTDPATPGVDWQRCSFDERDLTAIDVSGETTRLIDASFTRSVLNKANMSQAKALRAKFNTAQLKEANFKGAKLNSADFTKAELEKANFENADLRNAKMVRAQVKGANFKGAKLKGTDFRNADLSGATWTDGRICADNSIGQCQ